MAAAVATATSAPGYRSPAGDDGLDPRHEAGAARQSRGGQMGELEMAVRVHEAGKQHAGAEIGERSVGQAWISDDDPPRRCDPQKRQRRPRGSEGPSIGSSQAAWRSSIVRARAPPARAGRQPASEVACGVAAGEGGCLVAPAIGIADDLVVHRAALRDEAGVLDARARSRPRSGGSARRPPRRRSPRSSGCRSRWRRSAATPGRSSSPGSPRTPARSGSCRASTRATASVRRYWKDVSSSPASAVFAGWKVQAMNAVKPPVRSCSSRRCSR